MKLFVTGSTGFLGSHFLRAALGKGHLVTALRRSAASLPRLNLPALPCWLEKDLCKVTSDDLAGHDVLVHLAAAGVDLQAGWEECFRVNVIESLSLWRTAASAGIEQFIICGSCFEYGRSGERYEFIPTDAPLEPLGPYAASKAAATMAAIGLAAEKNLRLLLVRPFHVFGEGEAESRFWPSLRKAALAGEDFPMTVGEQVRDFVPVETAAHQLLDAYSNLPPPGRPEIRHIGAGCPQTLQAFAEHWWSRWNARGQLILGAKSYRQGEMMSYVPQI